MPKQSLRRPKKLIVCCDGTWMDSDSGLVNEGSWFRPIWHLQTPSNVTRIGRSILSEDKQSHPQVVYYQAGVGTGFSLTEQLVGGAAGKGLSENIREAYSFLANNYADGDSIFLIGFSRGAFTARSIGGLIGAMGLLEKRALPIFYDIFKDWENTGSEDYRLRVRTDYPNFNIRASANDPIAYLDQYKAELKKHGLTRDVKITAIGVWDTVGALGVPTPQLLQRFGAPPFLHQYRFFDTGLDNHIQHAFQALALDERRASYSPAIWERPTGCDTRLKQVWFPGVHSNVGGSYEDAGLADVSLAWMMSQLEKWIEFDEEYIADQWRLNNEFYREKLHRKLYHPREYRPEHTPLLHSRHNTMHVMGNRIRDEEENVKSCHPGWALTKIYNSNVFPTSLGGTRARTPGLYTRTDYYSGSSLEKPLRQTHEYIHASVRTRMNEKGKGYDDRGKYQPAGLRGWEWETDAKGEWRWVYRGGDRKWEGKELREDELGRFELMLLRNDPDMQSKVINEGVKMFKRATLGKIGDDESIDGLVPEDRTFTL